MLDFTILSSNPTPFGASLVRGDVDLSALKEMLSLAYVRAVAASAGCTVHRPEPDVIGVDLALTLPVSSPVRRITQLDIQVKSTTGDVPVGVDFPYELKGSHFNALRTPHLQLATPRILVVFILPPDIDDWLEHLAAHTLMRRAAYWLSLMGQAETTQGSKTVRVPTSQAFTVDSVCDLHEQMRSGVWP